MCGRMARATDRKCRHMGEVEVAVVGGRRCLRHQQELDLVGSVPLG